MGKEYRELELEAGHWLIQRHPKAVVSAVLDQINRNTVLNSETTSIER